MVVGGGSRDRTAADEPFFVLDGCDLMMGFGESGGCGCGGGGEE